MVYVSGNYLWTGASYSRSRHCTMVLQCHTTDLRWSTTLNKIIFQRTMTLVNHKIVRWRWMGFTMLHDGTIVCSVGP